MVSFLIAGCTIPTFGVITAWYHIVNIRHMEYNSIRRFYVQPIADLTGMSSNKTNTIQNQWLRSCKPIQSPSLLVNTFLCTKTAITSHPTCLLKNIFYVKPSAVNCWHVTHISVRDQVVYWHQILIIYSFVFFAHAKLTRTPPLKAP